MMGFFMVEVLVIENRMISFNIEKELKMNSAGKPSKYMYKSINLLFYGKVFMTLG